jgi:hypothetical protein
MFKAKVYFLFFSILFTGVFCSGGLIDLSDFYGQNLSQNIPKVMTNAPGTVKVSGRKQGTGVLIIYENKPVVLTNSHVVGTLNEVKLGLTRNFFEEYSRNNAEESKIMGNGIVGKVLLNFPAYDFAILSFESGLPEFTKEALYKLAEMNGHLCPKGSFFCSLEYSKVSDWIPPKSFGYNAFVGVSAVIDDQQKIFKIENGYTPEYVKDIYISGLYKKVIYIPSFTRPGASGGGFYYEGILTGLVTKVSSGGDAFTVAIPMSEIGRVLSDHINGQKLVTGEWILDSNFEDELNIYLKNEVIISSGNGILTPAGGPLSDGGGPLSDGGGPLSDGGGPLSDGGVAAFSGEATITNNNNWIWNLLLNDSEGTSRLTLNPFSVKNEYLYIAKSVVSPPRRVAYLVQDEKWISPSLAELIWYKINEPQKLKIVFADQIKEDLNSGLVDSSVLFGRLYRQMDRKKNEFRLLNFNCDSFRGVHLQALDYRLVRQYDHLDEVCGFLPDRSRIKMDDEYYFQGTPYRVRISEKYFFDVKFLPTQWGVNLPAIKIKMAKDLQTITISGRSSIETVLRTKNKSTDPVRIYRGEFEGNEERAAVISDGLNLGKIKSVFIQTSGFLVELIGCNPTLDGWCAR